VRLMRAQILGVVIAGSLAGLAGAAPAQAAEAPWWGVTMSSRPTNLRAGAGSDEVQKVTVSATGGDFILLEFARALEVLEEKRKGNELLYTVLPYNAAPATVQAALEKDVYGAGNVTVAGAPGEYEITFTGQRRDQPVAIIDATSGAETGQIDQLTGESITAEPLTGANAEVTAGELTHGKADGQIAVMAENLGNGDANGSSSPVTVVDTLSPGLKAVGIEGHPGSGLNESGTPVQCSPEPANETPLTCTYAGTLKAYEPIEVRISVIVEPGASSGEENTMSVSGGGAVASSTVSRPILIGGKAEFGVEESELIPEEYGGAPDTQAGSHPFQLTSVVSFNQTAEEQPVAQTKDLGVLAPPGLIGDPTPFAQCTDLQFDNFHHNPVVDEDTNECAPQTAIGVADITYDIPGLLKALGVKTSRAPLFNLTPQHGEPARFGFYVPEGPVPVILDTSVRTGGDYGVTVASKNIIQIAGLLSAKVTLWGVPGDPRHDGQRGWACMAENSSCATLGELTPPPFLSMPTSCTGPLQGSVEADSWLAPKQVVTSALTQAMPALDGCNHLPFSPEVSIAPDVSSASTPSGLTVGVHIPQSAALNPTGLSESTLKNTTVTLPEGVSLNAGGADGLEACSEAQIGYLPGESSAGDLHFTPGRPQPFCPNGAKIATVEIETPLLPNALKGDVYLASQDANPFRSLVAMYIVAEDPISGTLVKLPGEVSLSETGQVVARFDNTPQLPFETLRMHFFGGARAPLSTPPLCGAYTTVASFAPWSGEAPVQSSSTFNITSGPNEGVCRDPLPFAPSLTAGTTSIQAGGFTPFTTTFSREDGNQNLQALTLHMPAGLSGALTGVKLCDEADANAGACGPESEIGETIVSVGVGGNPYTVTGGRVYITEKYEGAPFGLSIVNPAKAGPFDLGQVIVRARIEIDPTTAALTITTDPTGPHSIPQILDGIPLEIKHINVTINRPNFTFNPTNCNPMAITGTLSSIEGASQTLSVPFQATNCAVLKFAPKFAVSTSGKTSKANGASLSVKLTYPQAPQGSEANIARVKVDLPKLLPSRLTTLQKACTAAQFEVNPAGCPAASIVGHARATTPILPVPLEGPAYFVSHGGEAFPSLIVVLQGYGVTVDLVGTTFISKAGITSSTFKTVPDVPVGTFELNLPQEKYSALAANGNLCASKLTMPTAFVAQNGMEIHQSTPIGVTGCAKKKALTRTQKLTLALKACHKRARGRRASCERQARKKYGPVRRKKK
jgi:hypothetical protein